LGIPLILVSAIEIDETTTCTRIIDGDSFETSFGEIRLADIDCPDRNDPGYEQAADVLSSLILNQQIYLDIDDVYGTDQYDRYVSMCYVKVSDSQYLNVNKYLVDNDYAVISNFNNEFNPSSWQLYYLVDPNGGASNGNGSNGQDGLNFGSVLPVLLLGLVAVVGIVMYSSRSHTRATSNQAVVQEPVRPITQENATHTYLTQCLDHTYHILTGIALKNHPENIEHIVLGENGVFVLESRDWTGRISCVGDNWVNNGKMVSSPSQRVKDAARKIREILLSSGVLQYTKLWVDGVVVLLNADVDLSIKFNKVPIRTLTELCDYLTKKRTGFQFTQQELQAIRTELMDNMST
jgi:hypothetical protein